MPNHNKTCPICEKPSDSKFAPFCSKRCGDIDLNRWLGGQYAIAADTSIEPLNDNEAPEDEQLS